jgi:hypothetical protein
LKLSLQLSLQLVDLQLSLQLIDLQLVDLQLVDLVDLQLVDLVDLQLVDLVDLLYFLFLTKSFFSKSSNKFHTSSLVSIVMEHIVL